MSFLDSSSLSFWESVSKFGFVMVIVGVVGEGAELVSCQMEKTTPRRINPRKRITVDASD